MVSVFQSYSTLCFEVPLCIVTPSVNKRESSERKLWSLGKREKKMVQIMLQTRKITTRLRKVGTVLTPFFTMS